MIKYLKNYKDSTRKITLKNIRNYLVSMWKWYRADERDAYQFYYRVVKADKKCLKNGYCPCFCDVPQKFMELEKCDKNCYPIWQEELDLLELIKKENINLILLERQAKFLLRENNLKNPYERTD